MENYGIIVNIKKYPPLEDIVNKSRDEIEQYRSNQKQNHKNILEI